MRRLIYKKELLKIVGCSYPSIWAWMRQGTFPKSREIGRKVAWYEDEVQEWLDNLPERELKPLTEDERATDYTGPDHNLKHQRAG